jgi:hypothetical protein
MLGQASLQRFVVNATEYYMMSRGVKIKRSISLDHERRGRSIAFPNADPECFA